jgi:uncharacterized protein (TIGR04222 family)
MNAQHVELWRRIEGFQLDSAEAALPFSARLARENNWSPAYAQRVITEYKRFTFLAVAAGHPVSPSEDVDQAWHLHLTYSENYWKVFCPEILGKPFHHQPTKGGATEKHKFEDWYARTLESYEKFFGVAPPRDIWPAPEAQRKGKHLFIRVDRERNWIIPKPRLSMNLAWSPVPLAGRLGVRKFKVPIHGFQTLKRTTGDGARTILSAANSTIQGIRQSDRRFHISATLIASLGLIFLLLFCNGAMLANSANVFDWRGPDFLTFYVILFAITLSLALLLRSSLRRPGPIEPINTPELDGYATAFLNGGKILTVNTPIANLVRQGAVQIGRNRLTSVESRPDFSHELEKHVFAAGYGPNGNSIANVRSSAKSHVAKIAGELQELGLVLTNAQARKAILLPLMLALVAIAVGIIKIAVGLDRGKPVGFLVALCFFGFITSLIALARPPRRTRLGDAVLRKLQERHTGTRYLGRNVATVSAAEFATFLGLFGMTALAGTAYGDLRKSLQPVSTLNSGSSCGGSSCGGSCGSSCGGSCGGGCGGGCGGCGGS